MKPAVKWGLIGFGALIVLSVIADKSESKSSTSPSTSAVNASSELLPDLKKLQSYQDGILITDDALKMFFASEDDVTQSYSSFSSILPKLREQVPLDPNTYENLSPESIRNSGSFLSMKVMLKKSGDLKRIEIYRNNYEKYLFRVRYFCSYSMRDKAYRAVCENMKDLPSCGQTSNGMPAFPVKINSSSGLKVEITSGMASANGINRPIFIFAPVSEDLVLKMGEEGFLIFIVRIKSDKSRECIGYAFESNNDKKIYRGGDFVELK